MNKLEETIINEINKKGPITFERFMDLALYHEQHGYYSSGKLKIGKVGDFYTSPHVHQAFGQVISNFILKAFDFINADGFTVVEIGAGKGYLAYDILTSIREHSQLFEKINYFIVDKNTGDFIKELGKFQKKVKIFNNISELGANITGVIISNELFDSLPFHRLIYYDGNYKEYYVDNSKEGLIEITGNLSTPDIKKYIQRYKLDLIDSKQIEVNLNSTKYMKILANIISKGFILTIDYGFLYEELFSNEKPEGTYRCFHKHTVNKNPFNNIGNQDITADVDFSNLILTGNQNGLEKLKYTTQGQFLIDWGILDIYEQSVLTNKKGSNAIKNLFLPGMMGNYFKCLIQQKNIDKPEKFYPQSELTISFGIN